MQIFSTRVPQLIGNINKQGCTKVSTCKVQFKCCAVIGAIMRSIPGYKNHIKSYYISSIATKKEKKKKRKKKKVLATDFLKI